MEIQSPNPAQQRALLPFIFLNERELRAGWRLLIACAIFYLISSVVFLVLQPLLRRLGQGFSPASLIVQEALGFLIVALTTWIMSKIEHRNMGEYGLPLRASQPLSCFFRGYIFWGFLPLSLLLLTLRALHRFYFGNLILHQGQIFYWAAMWGILFCLVGFTEEYSLRGYLLYTLADGIGFWPAAVVLASLFAIAHTRNPGETRIGILMTAFFAMFAAVTLRYTGNLWLAVGAHAGWDWGQSYFYGVNDSGLQLPGHLLNPHIEGAAWLNGGSDGPEGSILCLVLMACMSLLFVQLYRRANKPVPVVTSG